MDYKNGRTYQIRNTVDDDVYVGSTTQTLCKRMAKHRVDMNAPTKLHRPLYVKMQGYGVDCFYIELIEECPCENKEQLRKREGHFIREIATLNMCQAGRTKKEWHEENKPRKKEYREENKEQIAATNSKYYEQNKKN